MSPDPPVLGSGLVLLAGRLLTPEPVDGPGWVHVFDGRVRATAPGPPPAGVPTLDLGDDVVLVPGLVDTHLHGGGGASMTSTDRAEIAAAVAFHLRHGTTVCLVSLVTAPWSDLLAQTRVAADLAAAGATATGHVLGVHLEGPFLSEARRGVHPVAALRRPTPEAVDALLEAGSGQVRMLTLAPELPGALGRTAR